MPPDHADKASLNLQLSVLAWAWVGVRVVLCAHVHACLPVIATCLFCAVQPVDKCPTTYRMPRQMASADISADKTGARRAPVRPRRSVVELSLLFLCLLNGLGADAAKNRGWLPNGQLVRGTRPATRSGHGLAVYEDYITLNVIFGGDVQGSKHLRRNSRALV